MAPELIGCGDGLRCAPPILRNSLAVAVAQLGAGRQRNSSLSPILFDEECAGRMEAPLGAGTHRLR